MKLFEEVSREGKVWKRPVTRGFPSNWTIEVEVGDLLYGLIRALKPKRVIETGTFEGVSAARIAQAMRDNKFGELWSIDHKDYGARKFLEEVGVGEYVKLVLGESPKILEEIISKNKMDFAFLDNGHLYSIITGELEMLHKYQDIGSYLTGHDYFNPAHHVRDAVEDFLKRYPEDYDKLIINSFDGMYILRRIK